MASQKIATAISKGCVDTKTVMDGTLLNSSAYACDMMT